MALIGQTTLITYLAFLRRNPAVVRWQGKVVGAIYIAIYIVLGARLALQEK